MTRTSLPVLSRLRHALAHQRNATEIARTVHVELAPLLSAPIWLMSAYDSVTQTVSVIWQIHHGQELPGGTFPLGDGVTSTVIRSRSSMLIREWSREGPTVHVQYATTGTPRLPESSAAVPILLADEVLGVLSVQDYRPYVFDEADVRLLEAAARAVAPALGRARAGTHDQSRGSAGIPAINSDSTIGVQDAEIIVDHDGHVVHYSHAARRLLEACGAGMTFGQSLESAVANTRYGTPPITACALAQAMAKLKGGTDSVTVEVAGQDSELAIRVQSTWPGAGDDAPEGRVITPLTTRGHRALGISTPAA